MYAVQRPNQLHTGEVFAAELRRHGLQLSAVKKAHDRCFHNVGKMVPQCDLVAAKLLCLGIEEAPAHPGAEITGIFLRADSNIENIAVKNRNGNPQQRGIIFNEISVFRLVAGVHDHKHQLKGTICVTLKLLHQLCQHNRILAAGNAHGDFIAGRHQLIPLYRSDKRIPNRFSIGFNETALCNLLRCQFPGHSSSCALFFNVR